MDKELLENITDSYLLLADVIFSLRAISTRKLDHENDIVSGIEIALRLHESLKEIYLQYTGNEYTPPNSSEYLKGIFVALSAKSENSGKDTNPSKVDKPEEMKNKSFNPNCLACMEQRLHTEEECNNHPGQGKSGQEGKYSR